MSDKILVNLLLVILTILEAIIQREAMESDSRYHEEAKAGRDFLHKYS